jgi:hydrophobe/amphiphile efflux-1 (HAE1) family protein
VSLSQPFIVRPVATTLLTLAIFLIGAIAYPLLPVAPLPQVEFPTIQVSASLPGASPETMASSVATPLENRIAQVPGITQMTSSSGSGATAITVQFDLDVDIDAAAQEVQSAINTATRDLPRDLPSPPTYRKVNPADAPIMLLSLRSETLPITQVSDYAATVVAQQISQIAGVAQVSVQGEQKPAVRVQLDPDKLAALGLAFEDVRGVIGQATVNSPKGTIDGERRSFTIYADDQILDAAGYDELVLAYRNGAPIRVRDVGRAIPGPENARLGAWLGTQRGVSLVIFKQAGANVIETVERIDAMLPELRRGIPPAITLDLIADRTKTIRASVAEVQMTLVLTMGLVIGIVFVFLRDIRATFIASLVVPTSIVASFAAMYVLDYSLDNLSLMGLTIAVGFVIDDAIVMLENVYRHIEEGSPPLRAALDGAREMGFTILSITLSLVAVFIPVLLMGGIVGRLFREFAIVVSITIMVSGFVSLTLIPMACARLLRPAAARAAPRGVRRIFAGLDRQLERFFVGLERGYASALRVVLRHRKLTLASLVATVAATGWLFSTMPTGFFPQQDTGFIQATIEGPADASFNTMAAAQLEIAEIIAADPAVDRVQSSAGVSGFNATANTGRFFISLAPLDRRTDSASVVIERLRRQTAKFPGITVFFQATQDLNIGGIRSKAQFQYSLRSADIDSVTSFAPKLIAAMQAMPELRDVTSDQESSAPAVTLAIDRDAASRFGVTPAAIDDALYNAFGQRQVASYYTQVSQYRVIMEVDPALQGDPAVLDRIRVPSPATGDQIPLSLVASFDRQRVRPVSIGHLGQLPAVTISFNLAPGIALGDAITALAAAEREVGKPPDVEGSFQGAAAAFQSSLETQPQLIAAALIAIYLILGMLYESYIHPLTILSTLPSAGLGALLALDLFGYDLDVIAFIGILLLIGIVKKNAIMMIDFAIEAERHHGMTPLVAIYEACVRRFRPIMMTTMAALVGGIPLMLAHGAGAELRQPLGFAMVGGLVVSQALTLFTTPVVYLAFDRLRRDRRKRPAVAP